MSRLARDGAAEPVSRDQDVRRVRGQGNIHFPCSADHEQDWQPYPVDLYSAIFDDHTYIKCTSRKGRIDSVAANPDNPESNKEAGGGAQGTQSSRNNCTCRESVSPLSRLIRGFRDKYH